MPYLALLKALPWKLIGYAALALAAASLFLALKIERRTNAKLHAQLEQSIKGREADRAAYQAAQKAAAEQNKAQVQRIITEQEQVTHEVQSNLGARLELIRSELRKSEAAHRAPGGAQASPVPDAPCRADDPAGLYLTPEERLRAAESEERHAQLIDWIERQLKVEH